MKSRVLVAIPLVLLMLAVVFTNNLFLIVTISAFAFCATYEVSHVSLKKDFRPFSVPAYAFSVSFPFVYYFLDAKAMFLWLLICFLSSTVLLVIRRSAEPSNVLISYFLYVFPILDFICLLLVSFDLKQEVRVTAKAIMFVIPVISDTMGFFVGRALGKHKLCPVISPKKTIEGAVGSISGGIIAGFFIVLIQYIRNDSLVSPVVIIVTCLFCSFAAIFGDLFASLYKRWADVKDFSGVFKEHGGVMDRLDSILLCCPVVYLMFSLFC